MDRLALEKKFETVFNTNGNDGVYFAPGRVNLIGEHVDYNGGNVFPCAIDVGTTAIVGLRDDREVHVYSQNFENRGVITFSLDHLERTKDEGWSVYIKGIFQILKNNKHEISQGMNILYYGTIPNGAGLSSSASIEIVTAYLLNDLFNLGLDRVKLALYSQACENQYVGVNTGIMDQFIIAVGKKDHAILLNTETLDYEDVPFVLKGYKLVVTNTNVHRNLAGSKYNERRAECEAALKIAQQHYDVTHLAQLSLHQLKSMEIAFHDTTIYKRALHVVSECQRTNDAVAALRRNDLKTMGELMNQSHESLRDDYEVSCPELDKIVEVSWGIPGVLGSRMTGAGFGGCTISIVDEKKIELYQAHVSSQYELAFGFQPSFYSVNVGNGVMKI